MTASASASHTAAQLRGAYFYFWSALACAAVAPVGVALPPALLVDLFIIAGMSPVSRQQS